MDELLRSLIMPSGWIFLCLILGALLLAMKRRRKWSLLPLGCAAFIYLVLALQPTTRLLLLPLENAYPPLSVTGALPEVDTIVVLAGYGEVDPALPQGGNINSASAFRIMEAARLWRALAEPAILISGKGEVPEIMAGWLETTGIDRSRIQTEGRSRNTYESALHVRDLVGDRRFLLVTSAFHMPRAMGVFEKMGMSPVPAPTQFAGRRVHPVARFIPSAGSFRRSEEALHEYMGLLWYRIRGRL